VKNIFYFLRKHKLWIFVIVLLLIAQMFCDLSLPNLTASILNVGIQQNGIEDGVPETIRSDSLQLLESFLSEEQIALVESSYGSADSSGIRTLSDSADREALSELLLLPEVTVYILQNPGAVESMLPEGTFDTSSLSDLQLTQEQRAALSQQILGVLDQLSESYKDQLAVAYVSSEYTSQGLDLRQIQAPYLKHVGWKMVLLSILMMILSILTSLLASRVAAKVGRDLRNEVFAKVTRFSSQEMEQFSSASLITRCTNDIQQIQAVVVMLLRMVIYAPILAFGGIFMVVRTTTGMSWIIVIAVAALLSCVAVLGMIVMPKFKIMQSLVDRVNLVSRELLNGVMPIRAFSRERHEEIRFDEANTALYKTQLFTNRAMTFMSPVMMLIMNGVSVLIVWVSGHRIDQGVMQIGEMSAFLTYAMVIVMSFLILAVVSIVIPRAAVSADRIREVLDAEVHISDPENPRDSELSDPKGELCFDHVSFHYPDADENTLTDISFRASPGTTTAIIGSTGCGKSTALNLIPRFYDVTGGSVSIDGIDIREISQEKLRSLLGYVPQKGFLFSGTIESNLKYADESISEEDMELAAEIAQATEFISEKEEGFLEPISQGGTNISGGQKQRLSIARAIARHPKIFLFDDSFSALDYKTDLTLRKMLHEHLSDATVIIVAQRISTILHADQILVLDDGCLVGVGTHAQLLENCATYQEIARSQLSEEELTKGGDANG